MILPASFLVVDFSSSADLHPTKVKLKSIPCQKRNLPKTSTLAALLNPVRSPNNVLRPPSQRKAKEGTEIIANMTKERTITFAFVTWVSSTRERFGLGASG